VAGPGWRHPDDDRDVDVAVDVRRTVRPQPGVRPVRISGPDDLVLWNPGPPRVRPEVAAIADVADLSQPMRRIAVLAVLADLCQARHTTPSPIREVLDATPRVRDRMWIRRVLTDLSEGTCSVLEHGYVTRVERAHGLPHGLRQVGRVTAQGLVLRDVSYEAFGLDVEQDGRLFHDSAGQRDRDLDRDLEAAVSGASTVRLGWGQAFDRPCLTSDRLARLLRRGGWRDGPRPCGPPCLL
jgi:hypothetical protein